MQSIVVYGRLLARALVSGINTDNLHPFSWGNYSTCAQSAPLPSLRLVSASSGISKTQSPAQITRKWMYGDDACFIAEHKTGDVLGVADGVGGWRSYGVDPSLFPRLLMETCERLVKEGHFQPQSPISVLTTGYNEIQQNKSPLIGSCTACLVALHREQKKLHAANLGDSGFMVIREGDIVHRSEEQQHYFNTPFQLSVAPTQLEGVVINDSPASAQSSVLDVLEGDVILLGTDGLFDNMNDEMILRHIRKLKDHRQDSVQQAANHIARHAHELAFDSEYISPFSVNAAANGYHFAGGKPDDITVLLAKVTEDDPFSSASSLNRDNRL